MAISTLHTKDGNRIGGEVAIHVLAQLPDSVHLSLRYPEGSLPRLRLLAQAYGILDRLALSVGQARVEWSGTAESDGKATTLGQLVEGLWPQAAGLASSARDDSCLRGHRFGVVTNLPAPYRIPLFTQLARRLDAASAAFRVFFLGSHARGRSWFQSDAKLDFDHEFVRHRELPIRASRPPQVPLDLGKRLALFQPTSLLAPGFSLVGALPVQRYATRTGVPFGLWSGETSTTAVRRPRVSRLHRRWLTRQAGFGVSYGSRAGDYLQMLNPDLPVVYARNSAPAEPRGVDPRTGGAVELLAVADLSLPGKGIEQLVDALAMEPRSQCRLTVIGTKPPFGTQLAEAERDRRIRLTGPLPRASVQSAYDRSHVFLFPSRIDVFGLALVEAMASGLACAVSPVSGAVADLIVPGSNGVVVDPDEPASWAATIRELVDDDALRTGLGEAAARTIARRWTIDHAVEGMIAGFRLGILQGQ